MTPDPIEEHFADDPIGKFYPGSRKVRPIRITPAVRQAQDWDAVSYTKTIGGQPREFFTIGALAAALQRPVVTIRTWTRKGYIPQAPYRLPARMVNGREQKGRRLYTRSMVESTVSAFAERGLLDALRIEWSEHPDLPIALAETWARLYNENR